jgi:hypothetical protein
MKKLGYIVTVLSLLLLAACTIEKKDMVMEALKAERFEVTQTDKFFDTMKLDDTDPIGYYILDKDMRIRVYDFGSKEKQELGFMDFKKQRMSMNVLDPAVIQVGKYLVVASHPMITEEYQKKIQKALTSIQ